MPYGFPAATRRSHTAMACQPSTLTSNASSPEKLTRATRSRASPIRVSCQVMNGNAPLLGHRGDVHPQVRPLGLQPVLHPVEDACRATGGGVDDESVLAEPQHRPVV